MTNEMDGLRLLGYAVMGVKPRRTRRERVSPSLYQLEQAAQEFKAMAERNGYTELSVEPVYRAKKPA